MSMITLLSAKEFHQRYKNMPISYRYYETSAGIVYAGLMDEGIFCASFSVLGKENERTELTRANKIFLVGTDFQISVWQAALKIPLGATVTYHDIAQQIRKPKAYRAVANALAHNKIVYFVPCHRVVRKDGLLGGYAGGIEKKRVLLKSEGLCF